jgi:hypothetical protein
VAFNFLQRLVEVVADDDAVTLRIGTVFHLGRKLLGNDVLVLTGIGGHDNFARPGRKIDCHVTRHDQLGLVDWTRTGSDNLVDWSNQLGAVSQGADGLNAADGPHFIDTQFGRRRSHHGRSTGRGANHDSLDAGDLRQHSRH